MIILSKKRITLILSVVFLSIFVFLLGTGEKENQYIQTVSLPASGKTIVLDAGHGVPDERCTKLKWNDRSRNKFKNSVKSTKLIRTKRMYSNTYKIR